MLFPFFNRWLFLSGFLSLALCGCKPIISLGRNPQGEALQKIEALPNYRNGAFQNLDTTRQPSFARSRRPSWLRLAGYLARKKPANAKPARALPVVITDLRQLKNSPPTVVWFGHSSVLVKAGGAHLLFDPVFNSYAGPLAGMVQAFRGTTAYHWKDMPVIDALIISHDHYDHLDYTTVKHLRKKVRRVVVPVGVGGHFRRWGYPADAITELNWNETLALDSAIRITATPAHHRSNRTLAQRKTLWASYVIAVEGYKLYFSGDTGYSQHFGLIGQRYGPFDLALLECGQYNSRWPHSHLHPSQTAKAGLELKAKAVLPIHWAKFAESDHPWNEPVNLLLKSADSLGLNVVVPFIGQRYRVGENLPRMDWWNW